MKDGKKQVSEEAVRKGNPTLESRGSVYGNYAEGIKVRNNLMKVLKDGYQQQHDVEMPPKYQEYFWDICNKLSRLSKCPSHIDSWHDIQGYGALIENDLKETGDGV